VHTDFQYIQQAIRKTRRRRRVFQLWQGLWHGFQVGAVVWVVVLIAYKLIPLREPWPWAALAAVPLAAVAGMVLALLRRTSMADTPQWLDLQLGLKERLVTAWELAREKPGSPWTPLLIARAADALRQTRWQEVVRFRWPRQAYVTGTLLVVSLGLLWVPEYRSQGWRERQRQSRAQQEAGRELVAFARRELQTEALSPEVEAALREVETMGRQLLEHTQTPDQALQALAELARRLEERARSQADAPGGTRENATSGVDRSDASHPAQEPSAHARLASEADASRMVDRGAQARADAPSATALTAAVSPASAEPQAAGRSEPPLTMAGGTRGSTLQPPESPQAVTGEALLAVAQRLDAWAETLGAGQLTAAEQQRIASELNSLLPLCASSSTARENLQAALRALQAGNCFSAAQCLSQAATACRATVATQKLWEASRRVAQAAACMGTGRSWMECTAVSRGGGPGGSGAGTQPGGKLFSQIQNAMPRPTGLTPEHVPAPWLGEAPLPVARSIGEAAPAAARVTVRAPLTASESVEPRAVNLERIPRAYRHTVRMYFDERQP